MSTSNNNTFCDDKEPKNENENEITNIMSLPLELICIEISSTLDTRQYMQLLMTNSQLYKCAHLYPYDTNKQVRLSTYVNMSDDIKKYSNLKIFIMIITIAKI